jgi:polysaccharide deacetylase 2 family uncharacterized protein YibQ
MKRISTVFWSIVLGFALLAVGLGFAGGQSLGHAAVTLHPRPAGVPSAPVARAFERQLSGAHSLDAADDPRDPYDGAEDPVAERPAGWAPRTFDATRTRPRVALVVVDAGTAGTPARAFLESPLPFTLVVPAGGDDGGITQDAAAHGKRLLIDAAGADPGAIRTALAHGAIGAIGSFAEAEDARPAVAALGARGIALDALLDGDGFYRAARAARIPAFTRDVILDGRDGGTLLDALFGAALARAQRTGVAIVLLHARPHSLDAAERFAQRAERDGAELVPLDALVAS